jgi:hypothetical protein
MLFRKLEELFKEFTNRINNQREKLGLYISTSVEMYDYLSEVNEINNELVEEFNKINVELHKDDFWKFIEESSKIKKNITKLLSSLEEKMKSFRDQSKESLELQYEGGTHNLDRNTFFDAIRDLGGKRYFQRGGGHEGVEFKLFKNTYGRARHGTNQLAGGTFNSWCTHFTTESGGVKKLIEDSGVKHKYFVCFFMNYGNKNFRKTFIKKYKSIFQC